MSKEKPEIGDIWIETDAPRVVLVIDTGVFKDQITCIDEHFWKNCFSLDVFKHFHRYIGKSVCNINRLFEVQDVSSMD